MAKVKLKITATFQEYLEPQDYVDEFRELKDLEDDAEIDEDELEEFAIAKFEESIAEGQTSLDDLTDTGLTVEKAKQY